MRNARNPLASLSRSPFWAGQERLGTTGIVPPSKWAFGHAPGWLGLRRDQSLSGKVVVIPSVEQGIMPSFRAIHAAGLLIEHRRLFYVSVTRAMAACIVSHSALHSGATAFRLRQQPRVVLPRSQFLNEMGIASTNRAQGLSPAEAAQIVGDIGNL
jgi:UvrD-like helicase C-terminal domain